MLKAFCLCSPVRGNYPPPASRRKHFLETCYKSSGNGYQVVYIKRWIFRRFVPYLCDHSDRKVLFIAGARVIVIIRFLLTGRGFLVVISIGACSIARLWCDV